MSTADERKILDAYYNVRESRNKGLKARVDITLENGSAVIYSMGANNPVIRIDIKEEQTDGISDS